MLVQELLLKSGDKIQVTQRGNDEILNISLLDSSSNKLTPRARDAVRELFERFAIASPEQPDILFLGYDQARELIEAVSDKASLRPTSLMAYNTNEDLGKLLYHDFLSYYEQKASDDPEMVRKNLAYIGLRSDMRSIP